MRISGMPHPVLAQHLYAIIGFMRVATPWKQFKEMVQKAFPKKGETLFLPIGGLRSEQLAARSGEAATKSTFQ